MTNLRPEIDYDRNLKINIYGDSYVGKTSMINAYVQNKYDYYQNTIGIDFQVKKKVVNDVRYRVMIWDICGSERYINKPTGYFSKTNGVILLYSIDSRSSFEQLEKFMDRVNTCCDIEVPRILVGSKCDLESTRVVSYAEGEKLALQHGYKYFECSPKEQINILKAMDYMIEIASIYETKQFQAQKHIKLKPESAQTHSNRCFQ